MTDRITSTNKAITDGREVDVSEKEDIKKIIEDLKNYTTGFHNDYDDFTL